MSDTIQVPRELAQRMIEISERDYYENEHDEVGRKVCCRVLSYNDHAPDCAAVQFTKIVEQSK